MVRGTAGAVHAALGASLWIVALIAPTAAQEAPLAATPQAETERLVAWLQQKTTERGQRVRVNGWPDYTDEAAAAEAAVGVAEFAELRQSFDPAMLDDEGRIQFQLYEYRAAQSMAAYALREQTVIFTSLVSSPHQGLPTQLNQIGPGAGGGRPGVPEGEQYISRLEHADDYLDAARAEFEQRAETGVLPPQRMFAPMVDQAEAVITGAPFESGAPSGLFTTVSRIINGLDASEAEKTELLNRAASALVNDIEPAYRRLIASFERLEPQARDTFGYWAEGDDDAAYDQLISSNTTLMLGADEVHATGLRELERIEGEVRSVMAEIGFEGTTAQLYDHLRTDDRFYYPNTDEGRAAYLAEASRVIEEMSARLGELVSDPPDAPLDVIRYPPALETGAISAQYAPAGAFFVGMQAALPNASFVVNLADMRGAPKYLLQPLAYHEGLPGHHLHSTIEREHIGPQRPNPFFSAPYFLAYQEGWGLYAEQLPYELGLYADPYANLGRLGMEAWRAARLVVDTGIHAQGWTRNQAIAFMLERTPLTQIQVDIEVDRYADNPGQATAYMIGKLAILDLRSRAQDELGAEFDIRAFHDEVLGYGQLPLPILDEVVTAWIAERQASPVLAGGGSSSG